MGRITWMGDVKMRKLNDLVNFGFFAAPVPGSGLGTEGQPLPQIQEAAAQVQPGQIFLQNSRCFLREKNSSLSAARGWDRSDNKNPKNPKKTLKNPKNPKTREVLPRTEPKLCSQAAEFREFVFRTNLKGIK